MKIIDNLKKKKHRKMVFDSIVERAPNSYLDYKLFKQFVETEAMKKEELDEVIRSLLDEEKIIKITNKNKYVPGRIRTGYQVADFSKLELNETISVGSIEFKRFFYGDMMGAEEMNEIFEAILRYDQMIENKLENLKKNMVKEYWANLATVFGLFISVLVLMLRSTEPLMIESATTYSEIFLFKLVQLSPLALILLFFVIFLRFALKRL